MKLFKYNPFKPHIVQSDGCYYVRKLCLSFLGWGFLDADDPTEYGYWLPRNREYCRCYSLPEARHLTTKLKSKVFVTNFIEQCNN